MTKVPEDVPLDTVDVFCHGALLGKGGTCASLPVVYAAVGRRLGYPIKLSATKSRTTGHRFARWDDPGGERVNFCANPTGVICSTDDEMRTGQFHLSPEDEARTTYMRSHTPRWELAHFLLSRGDLWERYGKFRKAVEAYAWASLLIPEFPEYRVLLKGKAQLWQNQLYERKPRGMFPLLDIDSRPRRYPPELPWELEWKMLGCEATENLLNDHRLEERWWKPLREGLPVSLPKVGIVVFTPSGCDITFTSASA